MAVHGVGGHYNYVDNSKHAHTKKAEKAAEGTAAEEAKKANATEETEETGAANKTAQKPEAYKPDLDKINELKADMMNNLSAFKKMVYTQISGQNKVSDKAAGMTDTLKEMLNGVLGMTQEEAQAAIADDGFWGVEQTANRILDFAVAISGGDPDKISLLRDAVQKGFDAAGKMWGSDLPEISHQTLAKVMEGFDEWEKTGSAANIGSNKKAAEEAENKPVTVETE